MYLEVYDPTEKFLNFIKKSKFKYRAIPYTWPDGTENSISKSGLKKLEVMNYKINSFKGIVGMDATLDGKTF